MISDTFFIGSWSFRFRPKQEPCPGPGGPLLTLGAAGSNMGGTMPLARAFEERVTYFDYGDADRRVLADLRTVLEKNADSLVAAFYRHLLSYGATRQLLRDPEVKERLLWMQRQYLLSLAGPEIDEAYLAERRRIGQTHERIGLEPSWYLGAYALYLSLLTPLVLERFAGDLTRAERCLMALQKLLLFDASLAMDDYIERRERDLEALNRELAKSGRQLARDLETQSAELRHTTERARAAEHLASIGTLVAGLAHEIGTPMGVIQGHAKLLESKVSDDQAQWRLRTIQEQIARISKIIQSLLNMARPSRSTRGPVEVGPLLEETLAFVREKLARRGVSPQATYADVGSVRGDRERLQQVFLNLFLNAADAMPDGGVLEVTLAPHGDGKREVAVEVADTGCGIAPNDLEHVFDPFFTTKTAGEGNGLGLSVVRSIVTEHGGTIDVESRAGQGTRFRVVLPLA
jgi:signal transduction histidine kinase